MGRYTKQDVIDLVRENDVEFIRLQFSDLFGTMKNVAITARQLKLGSYMIFGKGEEANGGRERESIIADAVEAVIGAIYLDESLEEARKFIYRFVLNDLDHKRLFYDAKSILQEHVQETKAGELVYELIREEGPEHDKLFVVEARLNDVTIGSGEGKSKKAAQQHAAYDALLKQHIKCPKSAI